MASAQHELWRTAPVLPHLEAVGEINGSEIKVIRTNLNAVAPVGALALASGAVIGGSSALGQLLPYSAIRFISVTSCYYSLWGNGFFREFSHCDRGYRAWALDLYVSQLFNHIRNGCSRVAGAGGGCA